MSMIFRIFIAISLYDCSFTQQTTMTSDTTCSGRCETKTIFRLQNEFTRLQIRADKQDATIARLMKELETQTTNIAQLNSRVTIETQSPAFTAVCNGSYYSVDYYAANEQIVFPEVITNIGDHYNTTSGEFICPHTGLYIMHMLVWTTLHDYASLDLMKEDEHVMRCVSHDTMNGNAMILECQQNERIWVKGGQSGGLLYCGGADRRSTFSGAMLRFL